MQLLYGLCVVQSYQEPRGKKPEYKFKYEQHKLPGGSVLKVVPLVMEHFGSWEEEARKFLLKLAAFLSDEAGTPNVAGFLDFEENDSLYNYRSVINVKVISKKLSMLCGGSERPDSLSTQVFPN